MDGNIVRYLENKSVQCVYQKEKERFRKCLSPNCLWCIFEKP